MKPVITFQASTVKAAVWKNGEGDKVFFNVTVQNSYVDDAGNWHQTTSFGPREIINLVKVLLLAHSDISHRMRAIKASKEEAAEKKAA